MSDDTVNHPSHYTSHPSVDRVTRAMRSPDQPEAHAICGAKTRNGGTCKSYPVAGAKRCRMHGSSGPVARTAAAVNVLQAKLRGELNQRGWEPITDPVAEYALIGGEVVALKDMARERINDLEGQWENPSNGIMAEDTKAAVQFYERALDRAERTISRMVGHGLDFAALAAALQLARERPSREQAEQVVAAFRKVTDGLSLTSEQQALLPDLFGAAMVELTEATR